METQQPGAKDRELLGLGPVQKVGVVSKSIEDTPVEHA